MRDTMTVNLLLFLKSLSIFLFAVLLVYLFRMFMPTIINSGPQPETLGYAIGFWLSLGGAMFLSIAGLRLVMH